MRELLMPYGGSGLRRLLLAHALTGQQLVEQTATGNPATFEATAAKPLLQCKAKFGPVQSGTGAPSPTNVRPISGWTGINVYHSGENISDPTSYPVTWASAGTVYGGYVDLASGVLIQEFGAMVFTGDTSENWRVEYSSNFYIGVPSTWMKSTNSTTLYCNAARPTENLQNGTCRVAATGNFNIDIGNLIDVHNADDFKVWLASNNVQVVCKLTTPVTYQLTPTIINTLKGTNNLWSDANGNITVKYLTKGA